MLDYNSITEILFISFMLKATVLFMSIVSFAYFMAMFFKAALEIQADWFDTDLFYWTSDCSDDPAIGFF
jgi:hypothetical protein